MISAKAEKLNRIKPSATISKTQSKYFKKEFVIDHKSLMNYQKEKRELEFKDLQTQKNNLQIELNDKID